MSAPPQIGQASGPPPPLRVRPLRSLRVRIVAAFLAAVLAMTGAMVWLVVQQRQIGHSMQLVTEGYAPLGAVIPRLEAGRRRVDTDVERLLRGEIRPTTGSQAAARLSTEEMAVDLKEARTHAEHARRLARGTAEEPWLVKVVTQIGTIETRFQAWQQQSDEFTDLAEAGRAEEAEGVREALLREGTQLSDEIDALNRLVQTRLEQLNSATEEAQSRALVGAVSLMAAALALGTFLMVAVLRAVAPIGTLTTEVQRLAAGEYGGRVEVRGGDEVAVLAAEFNAMVRALQLRDRALVERAEQLNRLSRYLGSVLDALEEGLLVVENGQVTLTNPAATRAWGARTEAPPPEPLRGLAPGLHTVEGEGRSLHEVRVSPFGEGGVVVVVSDVTDQTRTRERLARSERLALIGQMLAQITHEVRNPLNALSLNAELLADELGGLDPKHETEAWDLLGTVANEIERLTQVTAHYLQLARRPRATLAREDLALVVDDVARLLAAELSQAGVRMEVRADAVPPQLLDGNQLKQALLNVVRNATEAGARHLVLAVSRRDGEIVVSLQDDGPGMTPEEVEKATEPFYSSKATGTGLGLAITKQILEDHDGTVRVDSAPGSGTTVTLVFPERPAASSSTSTVPA